MIDLVTLIAPPELNFTHALLLILVSFFTSAMTATFGLGGGAALIAIMSLFLPPSIVVPVHGVVQLGSNSGRAFLRRAHIQWHFVGWFALGSAVGAFIGGQIVSAIPETLFLAMIALFILFSVWVKLPPIKTRSGFTTSLAGTFTSAMGVIVGISGPLVITFLRNLSDRREIVATHALLMSFQNLFKLLTFLALGFAFSDYAPLIILMILSGFAGTNLGSYFLDKIPEKSFRLAFRFGLTAIAISLIFRAILTG